MDIERAIAPEVVVTVPYRGKTREDTYFITASTWEKRFLLQSERMALLLVETLLHYRRQRKYQLHEFVVMPNHFHLLITPMCPVTLEKAVQFIKGGFSFRARKESGALGEIWQTSFYDHRVRDSGEYERIRAYIHHNPVTKGLAASVDQYPYSSAAGFLLDEVPQRLKPVD